jgi:hypothetical protein
MKKARVIIFLLYLVVSFGYTMAQGILPPHRYATSQGIVSGIGILDKEITVPSFAYSLRKMRNNYNGYALRVRRSTDNAEADVEFDSTMKIVTNNSMVTVAIPGGGLTIGRTLRYSQFSNNATMYVSIWYDQGVAVINALQFNTSLQPILALYTAGKGGTRKPSVLFSGAQYLSVTQWPGGILGSTGRTGSVLLWTRPQSDSTRCVFGFERAAAAGVTPDWRWAVLLNRNNQDLSFDAAELCCGATRDVANSVRLHIYDQYSFVRSVANKIVRVAGVEYLNTARTATTAQSLMPQFMIGWGLQTATPVDAAAYLGNICEIMLYPNVLTTAKLSVLEQDQIRFWRN